jgi:hypothetical protein
MKNVTLAIAHDGTGSLLADCQRVITMDYLLDEERIASFYMFVTNEECALAPPNLHGNLMILQYIHER